MLIKTANLVIDVKNKFDYVRTLCRDYVVTGATADFSAEVPDEILAAKIAEDPSFSDGYIEALELYRIICRKALGYNAMLVHCAAVCVDDRAYLFTALSGTGKTTHIKLWKKRFGEKCRIINGDKPLIREINGKFFVCGTPWQGKENYGENDIVPIAGICILERGEKNVINKIPAAEAIPTMLVQTLRTNNEGEMDALLTLLNSLLEKVPFYRLKCNMDEEAAQVSYDGMRGDGNAF